ncbi:Uncharacterised protein [Raoultella ornithinolytica]|nr:Uncharacterised protein [Raoultella ornithinolytica]
MIQLNTRLLMTRFSLIQAGVRDTFLKVPGAMAKYKRKNVQSDNKAGLTTTNSS